MEFSPEFVGSHSKRHIYSFRWIPVRLQIAICWNQFWPRTRCNEYHKKQTFIGQSMNSLKLHHFDRRIDWCIFEFNMSSTKLANETFHCAQNWSPRIPFKKTFATKLLFQSYRNSSQGINSYRVHAGHIIWRWSYESVGCQDRANVPLAKRHIDGPKRDKHCKRHNYNCTPP